MRSMPCFRECERRGPSIVVGGPYNSGILATGTGAEVVPRFDYEVAATEVVFRVRRLERVCRDFNVPLAAAALQFPLAHPQVASVIPGLAGPEQVAQTLTYYRTPIPTEFWQELQAQNLIHEAAPLPAAKTPA